VLILRKTYAIIVVGILLISINGIVNSSKVSSTIDDLDPLVDVTVTVEIQAIRFLEDNSVALSTDNIIKNLLNRKTVITSSEPSLYVKVFINDEEFTSNIWTNSKYIYNPAWSATLNVPDESEFVDIKIQLWESTGGIISDGALCDLSADLGDFDVELSYSIKTGKWTGDDYLNDPSGYGRVCGCDDGTIYQKDKDSELWFNIYQNDYDGDTIPYWAEVNEYSTDPQLKNSGDPDNDKIPVEWEYKWGYNPFEYENHEKTDPDGDSINNVEEYLTSEWYSDPFRKDVFVEMDKMEDGPNGEKVYFPVVSKELITNAFDRQNIVFHLDMGEMGGYDIVPFDEDIGRNDLNFIYYDYFLHGDENNWRRGVFHYGLVVYNEDPCGYMFRTNSFQIASVGMERKAEILFYQRDIVYASAYMHELGHTFAFNPIPGHDPGSKSPWQIGWWINRPYKSVMNYAWMYQIVDYSDGSRRSPDIDDWERIDYGAFEHEHDWP
jgi:hypothetical protein